MAMEEVELIFIPTPLMGHVGAAMELAKLMASKFHHLTITVLLINLSLDPNLTRYTDSITSGRHRINFVHFPPMGSFTGCTTAGVLADAVIEHHKPLVRDIVSSRLGLAALVVDMFCTSMIDVGNEFGIPTYVFFTSNAAFLGIMFHFQTLQDELGLDVSELGNSNTELVVPSYANSVPPSVLPNVLLDKQSWSTRFLRYARKYREAKGIIVNTFSELEPHALGSYDNRIPPVYTIGPLLKPEKPDPDNEILQWLNHQPESSVVLLCFGSRGSFNADQVKEIANALERSGYRFVWSLRRPPTDGSKGFPGEYTDYTEVLPDGFPDRTVGRGKVTGWVPQTAALAHGAVGGFVSHCGWNSVLESLWYGVPIATWPIYAEQQLDAFQLVKELGLGVEISLDYCGGKTYESLVLAEDIERGIRKVMDGGSEVRAKVMEMRDKSRMALEEGGSSSASLRRLLDDIM